MKNIGILIPNLHSGGSERIASRLSIELAKKYNISLILFDADKLYYDFGGELIDMNLPAKKGMFEKTINIIRRIFKLRKIVKRKNIDLIFSFTSAANNTLSFSFAGCMKIISARGYAHLSENLKHYSLLCKLTDGILFNSKGMQELYLNSYPKHKNKTFVLYNLFDNKTIEKLSKEELNENELCFYNTHKVIVSVSRFCFDKGQWNLLKSFEILKKKVPDAGLVFVGHNGDLSKNIKKMASESKYSKDILFVGFQNNPFKYISKSKAYALSSLSEGFPNSLVEAMICATPVIATNCKTGPSEILFEKYNKDFNCNKMTFADFGIITAPFDNKADYYYNHINNSHIQYAKGLSYLLNDKKAKRYAIKAFDMVKKFDIENIIGEYIKIIEYLIKKKV